MIDESGDLGSAGTRYFSMAAIIMLRPRDLKKASKLLPKDDERKWHNSLPVFRNQILQTMSELRFDVVYTTVDKNNSDNHHPIYGNKLYEFVLKQVISDAMETLPCKDTNIYLDYSRFISLSRLRELVDELAVKNEVNTKIVNKVISEQNKCIQLADYIVGSVEAYYENDDKSLNIIQKKISIARRR